MKSGIGTICDLDGPLFEADNFLWFLRNEITQQNPNKICVFDNLYNRFKENIAQLINNISSKLSIPEKKLAHLFYETDINPFLRKGSRDFIQKMEDMGTFTIITKGDPQFQKSKLERLGLSGLAMEEKSQFIRNQIGEMKKNDIESIFVIDDRLKELAGVYQYLPEEIKPCLVFIHMQVGRHKREGYDPHNPDFESHIKRASDFSSVESIINPPSIEPNKELYLPSKERR